MSKFKIGDKVRRVTGDPDFYNEPSDGMFEGETYTIKDISLGGSLILAETEVGWWYGEGYFELVESRQPDVYSPDELSYIEELEMRVDQLEELCSEYAKIVDNKDEQIKLLGISVDNMNRLIVENGYK
jgi:hypothetical protein